MAKTNAMRLLDQNQIEYQIAEYEVDEQDLSGVHAAENLEIEPEQLFKTLVLKGERNGYFVCCIPSEAEVDLKKAAKAFGDKKGDLIPMRMLQELTGYIRGGCSPVGMKKQFPTFFDETALLFDEIYVSAGQRGIAMRLCPEKLAEYLHAGFIDLCKE